MYLKLHTLAHATNTHIYKRVIHVRKITERKIRLLIGCEQTAIPESTVFATSMSRHVVPTCHGNWPNPTSLFPRSSSLLPLFLSFLILYISPLPSVFFPLFEILPLVHFLLFLVGDPARFLLFDFSFFFALYVARYVFLAIHRFSFLLSSLSIAKGNYSALLSFLFFTPFLQFLAALPLFLSRSFSSTVLYFSLPCIFLDLLLLIFSFSFFNDLSRIFHESNLFSIFFPLIFSSHLPFSASFESAFPRALFTSLALFHASFHLLLSLFFHLFLFLFFFFRPPSLIPLAALPSSIYFDRS